MISKVLNHDETDLPAFVCVKDIQRKNQLHQLDYSEEQQEFAREFFTRAVAAYEHSLVYKSFRKKFIAIKIECPRAADRAKAAVIQLEKFAEDNGIITVQSGKHIIYRILKLV